MGAPAGVVLGAAAAVGATYAVAAALSADMLQESIDNYDEMLVFGGCAGAVS